MKNLTNAYNALLAALIGALGFGSCRTTKTVVSQDPVAPDPPVVIDRSGDADLPPLVYGPPPTRYIPTKPDTTATDSNHQQQPKVYGPPPADYQHQQP